MRNTILDLDAARREAGEPEGFPLIFKGAEFTLPAEFPVDVFDPLLFGEIDLAGIIREVAAAAQDKDGREKGIAEIVVDTLFGRPSLPLELIKAIYACYEQLFGAEQYAAFKALRPSLPDYARLTKGLFEIYGASLGEAFASLSSSESDGATQKQISPASTPDSTPDSSSAVPDNAPGSSE